jgi:hypothetical protein
VGPVPREWNLHGLEEARSLVYAAVAAGGVSLLLLILSTLERGKGEIES